MSAEALANLVSRYKAGERCGGIIDDTRYHFFRQRSGLAPKWWTTRKDETGTMHEMIEWLRQKYEVVEGERPNHYLILDREEP